MEQNKKTIVDIKELSKYLNLSIPLIRKLIYNNEIPYFRVCAKYEFDLDIINQWILNKHNDIAIGNFELEKGGIKNEL